MTPPPTLFIYLYIFLIKPYKNYIYRNPACPQRKPWLAPTYLSYCSEVFCKIMEALQLKIKGIQKKSHIIMAEIKTNVTHW